MSLPLPPKNSELEKALGCSVVHYKDALKYGQACRAAALEDAAKLCESLACTDDHDSTITRLECAEKIRSLI